MADATEDLIQSTSTPLTPIFSDDDDRDDAASLSAADIDPAVRNDHDDSDDGDDVAPNFLHLSLAKSSKAKSTLPKRGEKDFEENRTFLQSRTLADSRAAMHDALSHVRVHNTSDVVVGVYDERTGETFVSKRRVRGKMFATVGRWCKNWAGPRTSPGEEDGWVLEPEEALWALESGRLDVRYPAVQEDVFVDEPRAQGVDGEGSDDDLGIPMSLQGAYAAYIGGEPLRGGKLTAEKYLVYAALRRAGFIVTRAEEGWASDTRRSQVQVAHGQQEHFDKSVAETRSTNNTSETLFAWLYRLLFAPRKETEKERFARQRTGPLVAPGIYRSYDEIYRLLHLIPTEQSGDHAPATCDDDHDTASDDDAADAFKTTFDVHKAAPSFRKSAPGPPDFRICVVSAEDTAVPTLAQLAQLMDEQPPLYAPATHAAAAAPTPSFATPPNARAHAQPQADGAAAPHPVAVDAASAGNPSRGPAAAGAKPAGASGTRRAALDPAFAAPNTGTAGHMYARLKRGRRSVVLAVVDGGVVSYLRFADAGFGGERVFERLGAGRGGGNKGAAGGGGGRGGGRGRGRGRGRGA